jgi:hypothetical protein
LLGVVPIDSHIEIGALVSNRDMSFVQASPARSKWTRSASQNIGRCTASC